MITTCPHSDISMDTRQWAASHRPWEKMRKCNLKAENSSVSLHVCRLQITVNLNTYLPIGNHTADFPNKTMIHTKQIAAFCLKEQFGVLPSLISGSAITAVLIRRLGQETTPKHQFRRPGEHTASILADLGNETHIQVLPIAPLNLKHCSQFENISWWSKRWTLNR